MTCCSLSAGLDCERLQTSRVFFGGARVETPECGLVWMQDQSVSPPPPRTVAVVPSLLSGGIYSEDLLAVFFSTAHSLAVCGIRPPPVGRPRARSVQGRLRCTWLFGRE